MTHQLCFIWVYELLLLGTVQRGYLNGLGRVQGLMFEGGGSPCKERHVGVLA